jgi:beta-aspartyl-peptidase (threonine type)
MPVTPSLIVHGGAWDIAPETHQAHLDGVRRAAQVGWELLTSGASALDAVEQAVRLMEDDPIFDAGRGSCLNCNGHVQMDALIMDGRTLSNGAVAAVRCIANPISLARLVMTQTQHALLVGEGAQEFAERMGIPSIPEELLVVESQEGWWQKQHEASRAPDTVGAVAQDRDGNIAAATSTGGTPDKLAGRVGDSPLIGCGGYADNQLGGASATGHGESLMKVVMCKTTCDLMGSGLSAQAAAEEAVRRLADPRIRGQGGVIAIDPQGRVGFAYNTPHMARAFVQQDGTIVVGI